MRRPKPGPAAPTDAAPEAPAPPGGRALQRARQFAQQRGLPLPTVPAAPAPPAPAPAGKRTRGKSRP